MILDFDQIETRHLPAFKGGEKELVAQMCVDRLGKIMRGHLEPGASIGYHKHEGDSEVIYLLTGKARVLYDDTTLELLPGKAHYCPMGHSHSLINDGPEPLTFFAVVREHHVE